MSQDEFVRSYVEKKFSKFKVRELPNMEGFKFTTSEVSGELLNHLFVVKSYAKDISIKRSGTGLVVIITLKR